MSECHKSSLCPLTAVNADFVSYTFPQYLMTKPELKVFLANTQASEHCSGPGRLHCPKLRFFSVLELIKLNENVPVAEFNQGPRRE